jgi:hypothetical protein
MSDQWYLDLQYYTLKRVSSDMKCSRSNLSQWTGDSISCEGIRQTNHFRNVLLGIAVQKHITIKCNNLRIIQKCCEDDHKYQIGGYDIKTTVWTFVWRDCRRKLAQKVSGETATQPNAEPVACKYQVPNIAYGNIILFCGRKRGGSLCILRDKSIMKTIGVESLVTFIRFLLSLAETVNRNAQRRTEFRLKA